MATARARQAAASRITIQGVPFDATSTYRPGSRLGPDSIRQAFENVEVYSKWLDVDLEEVVIGDSGNLPHTASVSAMLEAVRSSTAAILSRGQVPATLGGEHTITYAAFGVMPAETTLLVFDAHLDLRDEYDDLRTMHATYLRRLAEERPGLRVVHVGGRAATREEWAFAAAHGITAIGSDELLDAGDAGDLVAGPLTDGMPVYVSVDLDVLDPAFGPGVANPEPAGLSTRDLLRVLRRLRHQTIRGFDIVELCPPCDPTGITAVAAARLLAELCCLIEGQ